MCPHFLTSPRTLSSNAVLVRLIAFVSDRICVDNVDQEDELAVDEVASLMSAAGPAGDDIAGTDVDVDRSHRIDIRGLKLLRTLTFWQLWVIMAILAGIGLMTIK
jgi:hypothetical protein